jgi:hypothetical protein
MQLSSCTMGHEKRTYQLDHVLSIRVGAQVEGFDHGKVAAVVH